MSESMMKSCPDISVGSRGSVSGSQSSRFLDSRRFTGNIKEMLDSSVSYVLDNIRKAIAFDKKGSRHDILEYPPIAIRETVLNALQHRDYSIYIEFCKIPRSREELENFTGLNRTSLYYSIIKPLTDEGLLRLTLPDKPRSKWQRFVSTW